MPKKLLDAHAAITKSKGLVYKDYGHVKGKYEDCEHRAFHIQAIKNSNARIVISPDIIFT